MPPFPPSLQDPKNLQTLMSIYLILNFFLAKAVTKGLDSFTGNTFLSLLMYEDQTWVLFCSATKIVFWKISENSVTKRLEYKPESFKFTFILIVTV